MRSNASYDLLHVNHVSSAIPGPEFPRADSFADEDPTIFLASEPDLSSAANVLGNWLAADPLPLDSNWSGLRSIPSTWDTNTETAIITLLPICEGTLG
jgi:hypothetical protein